MGEKMKGYLEFCGAFNGRVKMRDGETPEQCATRVETAMQKALDRNCARLHVAVGVDYGELRQKASDG
jgi:hypothetical protein